LARNRALPNRRPGPRARTERHTGTGCGGGPGRAEPPEQIKREIAALKANKSIPDADKKEDLAQLEAELKNTKPIQFKENIALVVKYFDKLAPLMQEQDSNLRPAD
jgi:hypothetical protein